ncbi:MAG: UDP-N-acetylmuramate:L-alanyl-gamma-D-glutamyl-meso-diaminopimelate ligase [Cellvibrionaceae bacterium]
MHVHILGVCGTFMGSLAQLAKAQGHRVTGSDTSVYPPMSTQLEEAGIEIIEGYDPKQLNPAPDLVVVGNAMSRGNPVVEALLNTTIPYVSGPQWLHDHVLKDKWVLAVAGTHGKTTTSSMLAWILEYAGMEPGYLIGGVPGNFGQSARLSHHSPFFVVEADEYDTAFFDKRSKFVHYSPRTLVMNNLEYDHADIFPDLAAIQTQFHHVVRIVPQNGLILYPSNTPALDDVIAQGCWTPCEKISLTNNSMGKDSNDDIWRAELVKKDGSHFKIFFDGRCKGDVKWSATGEHNVMNALAATAAARHVGVRPETAIEALENFRGVKRRMESLGTHAGVTVYDDFAHHPTAIKTTLSGLRASVGGEKIIALIEPRSNTMRLGVHQDNLVKATVDADRVIWFQPPNIDWSLEPIIKKSTVPSEIKRSIDDVVSDITVNAEPGTHIVVMSNGGFGGIHQKIIAALQARSLQQ